MAVATDLRAIILRYFNPIGSDPDLESGIYAKEPSHVLGQLVMAARGQKDSFTITGTEHPTRDGTGLRDYIHVWDLARAHVRAVERFDEVLAEAGAPSVVINVGRGDGVTVRELVTAFERVFGHDVPITEAPPRPGDAVGAFANVDLRAPAPRLADRARPSTRRSPRRWPGATGARKSWATSDPSPVRRTPRRRARLRDDRPGDPGLGHPRLPGLHRQRGRLVAAAERPHRRHRPGPSARQPPLPGPDRPAGAGRRLREALQHDRHRDERRLPRGHLHLAGVAGAAAPARGARRHRPADPPLQPRGPVGSVRGRPRSRRQPAPRRPQDQHPRRRLVRRRAPTAST